MKAIVLLALISMAAAAHINKEDVKEVVKDAVGDVIEQYTTLNDNLDIDAVIDDDNELELYVKCFKSVGPCTDLAGSYKAIIPEAVRTACRRCNPAQKHLAKKFFSGLKLKKPDEYQNLKKMLDPENKHFDAYEKAVADF